MLATQEFAVRSTGSVSGLHLANENMQRSKTALAITSRKTWGVFFFTSLRNYRPLYSCERRPQAAMAEGYPEVGSAKETAWNFSALARR